ncbi:DUF6223 family protein [Nonomuraea roseoviolacea]|uniref:Peptidoglycan/LPS O-acetylase OafA/YrhL n=1 Tax=Nonomuraea roseoviolacea subsp. carminata TaxID=160689 RepID=A0ABT1KFY9_9ACTN|nr:DUF6223 family protein [Nonomuraea roseoviolacea]MCP2352901.1 peptidoglycan/LPS O-acetylase OafA/YrhL [Nonomuraea roseoviolacea subsp. carminata]
MPVRRLPATAAAALLGAVWLATPAAAHALVQPDPVSAYTMTAGRLWSLVGMALGLAGLVAGGLALARSAGRIGAGPRRRGAIAALAAGTAGAVIGGLVVAAAKGGPGTGYGIVGGFLAIGVGLIAMVLAGLALDRLRRAADTRPR